MELREVGKRVKQKRKSIQMQQQDLAEKVGWTPGTVSRLEAGKGGDPTYEMVRKLAWALETSPAWLIDGDSVDFRMTLSRLEADPAIREALFKIAGAFETADSYQRGVLRDNIVKIGNICAASNLNLRTLDERDLVDHVAGTPSNQ